MKMLNEKHGYNLKYYFFGDMSPTCPKLNYKMNFEPFEIFDYETY